MYRLLLTLALLVAATGSLAAPPVSGLYSDRTRDAHGLDLQVVGDRLVGILLTFTDDGQPYWYLVDGTWEGDSGTLEIIELRYQANATPPTTIVGRFPGARMQRVADNAACGNGAPRPGPGALFDLAFQIDGESLNWCLEPIVPNGTAPVSALSGSWHAGEADSGWGLINYFFGPPAAQQVFQSLYVYDAFGLPRWAYAFGAADDTDFELNFLFPRGYCRSCPVTPLQPADGGSAHIRLVTPRTDVTSNRIALNLTYPFGAGGLFTRSDRPLSPITIADRPALVAASREGLLHGKALSPNGAQFLAIPFAAPPVGALRWRAPQAPAARTMPRDATAVGSACPQRATSEGQFPSTFTLLSEDCLQLNVWTPELNRNARRPVMVWFHGGGLTQGSAAELKPDRTLLYDGAKLADDGVVVVSANYRLGPLGFMAMNEFAGESPDHPTAGNYGLLDQIAALHWVQANIAEFGGDPNRVTIFGESAGGLSVCSLMASPLASGLFQRAIMQSGGCRRQLPALNSAPAGLESAFAQGARVIGLAGCSDASDRRECMRAVSWQRLIEVTQPTVGFGRQGEDFLHAVDQYALLEAPGLAIASGRAARVPLIVGINNDEMTTLLPVSSRPATTEAYEATIRQLFPTINAQVLAQYPAAAYPEPWYAYADLLDDLQFACPARAYSANHAATGNPVWRYVYTHVFAGPNAALGAFHGADIAFVFGTLTNPTTQQADLTAQIQRQWTRFAATGDPNGGTDPVWPKRLADDDQALELDTERRGVLRNYRQTYCDFWSRFVVF
ncbi:hypothetical protein C7S18_09690 [Ahniella affigens]|uniref:Carboxylesterase type B domain-containing protein n=1 Tax=Ahniella affigens TaxID=2021234 RepID=A0A2P1PRK1_9GAMM|nr:carboxylesterase family protein [Ahniella affigens]AVP97452.1 hypothetical protein C7S18_09690 [Ahniella affigens]